MPANRLRNHDWQRSLRQVLERGGSIDVGIAREGSQPTVDVEANLLWRVRVLRLSDTEILVERPTTLGSSVDLMEGVDLVVVFSIGQNRWMFRTSCLGDVTLPTGGGRSGRYEASATRLAMPEIVERCQRRSSYRVSTASLNLPDVDAWPLLDPKTVLIAERANELMMDQAGLEAPTQVPEELTLPEVGPRFSAKLQNLGGGGVGLAVPLGESQPLLRHKLFWLRITLPPDCDIPICATAKLVHTHMTASQEYYAGMAFDFTFNPAHQKFVVEQIGRYVANMQRLQLLRKSA